jgi:hypothetical protein
LFKTILQIWAGLFYLFNKIFFSLAERSKSEKRERRNRIISWAVYLTGLPAWLLIFILQKNWILLGVEFSGAPAMALGLYLAIKGIERKPPRWFNIIARLAIISGLGFSIYDFGGITTVNQFLELGVSIGFILGTYLLARQRIKGYYWFMLMNTCCAALMFIQDYPMLAIQQIVSLLFVIDAFRAKKRKSNL